MSSAQQPAKQAEGARAHPHSTSETPKASVGLGNVEVDLSNTLAKSNWMSLHYKTRLIFGVALTSLIGVLYAVSSNILLNSLKKAEQQDTYRIVKGVLGVVAQTKDDFSARYADWSAWDDTYNFIEDGNKRYIESGLTPKVFASAQLNLVLYIHASGRIVFGTGFDLQTNKNLPIPQELRQHLAVNDLLLQHSRPQSEVAGIVLLPTGPMLISSRPIVTSKGDGPIRGSLIVGRYLDESIIAKLAKTTRSSLQAYALNSPHLPADFQAVRSALSAPDTIVVRALSEQSIAGYTLLRDLYGQPAVLLRVDLPRHIYKQGQSSLRYLIASLIIAGLIFAGTTLPLLERLLLYWQERQEKEERYRAVVAQASEGIFLVAADSKRFLEANAAFAHLLGYSFAEVLALTLYDVVADDQDNVDAHLQHTCSQHRLVTEWQYRCKNGSLVDVEVSANLICYAERDTFCIVVRDVSERKRSEAALRASEKRLSWQASHDSLTELVNRREFERRLQQAILGAKTASQQHALCYLDLDQFKLINDTCGHTAGDELLQQIADLLQSGLRKTDLLARLGGDEFGILLYYCPLPPAQQVADKLREQLRQLRFVWQDKTFTLSASIGVVVIDADTPNLASVLSAADAACYAAKNKGRNRVHVYQLDDSQLQQQHREMQWAARIPKALEENRFCLYYQQIVPIAAQQPQPQHREILVRLQDESGELVPPMAFIPAAERYNLMHLIDRWVISTLFAHLATAALPELYAINLSGASINDDSFVGFVQSQFAQYGVAPERICFEITETLAITNLAKAARVIAELKALGCYFALDDFGSGMSSFAYLKSLPVDYLKIDGVFIKDIVTDTVAASMVAAIADVAAVMHIQTIAEFVENDAILAKLTALGVNYAQGYGISRPAPL